MEIRFPFSRLHPSAFRRNLHNLVIGQTQGPVKLVITLPAQIIYPLTFGSIRISEFPAEFFRTPALKIHPRVRTAASRHLPQCGLVFPAEPEHLELHLPAVLSQPDFIDRFHKTGHPFNSDLITGHPDHHPVDIQYHNFKFLDIFKTFLRQPPECQHPTELNRRTQQHQTEKADKCTDHAFQGNHRQNNPEYGKYETFHKKKNNNYFIFGSDFAVTPEI